MKVKSKICKQFAIYLPRKIVKHLNLYEGDYIEISVVGNEIHIKPLPDPLMLALHGEKFATIDPESIEKTSEEEQQRYEYSS